MRQAVPPYDADRVLAPDIEAVAALVRDGHTGRRSGLGLRYPGVEEDQSPMSPVPTRRSWLPGGALLVAAAFVAVLSGFALGIRSWPWYVGFAAAAILVIGWAERLWTRRSAPPPPRASAAS